MNISKKITNFAPYKQMSLYQYGDILSCPLQLIINH
jgi:hypothetical protein